MQTSQTSPVCTLLLDGGPITNAGLLEATSGGSLQLNGVTVNNAGGNITANSGSTVQLFGKAVIQGGTLNNNGGTLGTSGKEATLDGSTGAGAVTINGTYTSDSGSNTNVLGTITNKGNIQMNGGGANTFLSLEANTTLQGGGTVTLSTAGGGGPAIIEQAVGLSGLTLTNVDNTIQGAGIIGFNGLSLVNQAGGTVNANVSGGTLLLQNGSVTNAGLLEATGGGILQIKESRSTTAEATSLRTPAARCNCLAMPPSRVGR